MKPTCILAMPSSGSDWFADCYQKASGLKYFHKEFFNPMCNAACPVGFGSECVSHYKFIAQPRPERNSMEVFESAGCQLNKEVFCAFNVEWFATHFNCVTFVRSTETTFPPGRLRVYQWYDAVWNSLQDAGHTLTESTVQNRAREAHAIMLMDLLASSRQLQIPIISCDEIVKCSAAELPRALKSAWFASEDVVKTRVAKPSQIDDNSAYGNIAANKTRATGGNQSPSKPQEG